MTNAETKINDESATDFITRVIDVLRHQTEWFGDKVKDLRQAQPPIDPSPHRRHLSLRELGAKLGISHQDLALVEAGKLLLDPAELARLVTWYNDTIASTQEKENP